MQALNYVELPVEVSYSFALSRENELSGFCQSEEEHLPFGVELEKKSGALTIPHTALNSYFSHHLLFPSSRITWYC